MALSSNPRKLANAPIGSFIVAGYDNPLGYIQAISLVDANGDPVLADANSRLVVKLDQALPAGSATIGHVGNTVNSSSLYNGTTLVTPKFKKIDLAASGDLIAAVTSTKLRIISIFLTVAADTTLKFQSGATTDLTGAMTIKAGGGFVLGYNQCGYFETAAGEKLNLVMGTSVQVSGGITYVEI